MRKPGAANMELNEKSVRSIRSVLRSFVLALPVGCLLSGTALAETQATAVGASRHHAQRHDANAGIDDRVNTLTKALNLDMTQQSELRKVLEGQREQVKRVWDDTTAPAAYRVSATHAISDKTADRIRALLNEEQRKKYNPSRPLHEATAGSNPSVEEWMNKTQPKPVRFEPNKEDQNVEIR